MSNSSFAILVIRLLAVYLFAMALPALPVWVQTYQALLSDQEAVRANSYALSQLLSFGMPCALWLGAPWISRKALDKTSGEKLVLSFDDIFIIATVFAGLLILGKGITPITQFVTSVGAVFDGAGQGKTPDYFRLINGALFIVIPALLIFTPDGLLKLVKNTRRATPAQIEE